MNDHTELNHEGVTSVAGSAQTPATSSVIELDIHRLDLRFEKTRLSRRKSLASLVGAISSEGLRLPVRVADTGEALILIDGFRRLEAYRLLARDRIPAHCARQSLEEALRDWFAGQQGRGLDAIEEAWLIQQLLDEGGTRRDIAHWMGRGASWISRRIALLAGLNDTALQALRDGVLSSWAAERVWIPLARANSEDAQQLLRALYDTPLSTREVALWHRHYQTARGGRRQRLLEHPRLFVDTLKTSSKAKKSDASVPLDAHWLHQLEGVVKRLADLERDLPDVVEAGLDLSTHTHMESQTACAKTHLEHIAHTINTII